MSGIFMKIIEKKVPSYKIYEDRHIYAFLTQDAIQLGHSLVIPKIEVDEFIDLPQPYYQDLFQVSQHLARAIKQVTDCSRVGMIIAGYEVAHAHVHLVPTDSLNDFDFTKARRFSEKENSFIQEKISSCLAGFF